MYLEGDRLLDYAGWTADERRNARRQVRKFVRKRVYTRLGKYGSRVGRMQIVIAIMAECVVRTSNRDIATSVLCDVLEEVRNGPMLYESE